MRYARHPEVLWRSTSRGPVLLPPSPGDPERLGGVAAVVWELLDAPSTAAELSATAEDLLSPEAAGLQESLDALVDRGLLTVEP